MRNLHKTPYETLLTLAAGLLFLSGVASAHHGSGISYDTGHLWSTWATITEFNYRNPHPSMTFDRTTKSRSLEALKPGTKVKLYIGTSRAGGLDGIVMKIESATGENIVGERGAVTAVDMDGVPLGLQPAAKEVLPGAPGNDK
jgi:hypothetical protein